MELVDRLQASECRLWNVLVDANAVSSKIAHRVQGLLHARLLQKDDLRNEY